MFLRPVGWKVLLRYSSSPTCSYTYSRYSTSTVQLAFDLHTPPDGNTTHRPLLILHGFLGSKRNWSSLSKAFLRDLARPVYTLDLRNHGRSQHVPDMTYPHMARDVLAFCAQHKLENISLLGHSMGGKVAMSLALSPALPDALLSHLIVTDIAPAQGSVGQEFKAYVAGMRRIEEEGVKTRQEADAILKEIEPDPTIRSFLLTNMAPKSDPDAQVKFKVPLSILADSIEVLGGFPYQPSHHQWNGKTLFIKGTQSKYINRKNVPLLKQFFPMMEMAELDAGHWVHAEKPHDFRKLVVEFVQ